MIVIHSVTWSNAECVITYTPREAVKNIADLPVLKMHQLVVPMEHPNYPEIREIHEALQDVIRDIDKDYVEAPEYAETPDLDDDDEDD